MDTLSFNNSIPSEFTLAPLKYRRKKEAEEAKRKVNSTRLNDPISDELRKCSKKLDDDSASLVPLSTCCQDEAPCWFERAKTVESTD